MLREECHIGMKVYFGRTHGQKTLGEIVKLNPTKAKVKTLEQRGHGRASKPGVQWGVPYSMLTPASAASKVAGKVVIPVVPVGLTRLKYSQFQPQEDIHILQAMSVIYANLSPENLTCDGELSGTALVTKRAGLMRKLNGLFAAFGREVDEVEIYEWEKQRRAAFNPLGDADE